MALDDSCFHLAVLVVLISAAQASSNVTVDSDDNSAYGQPTVLRNLTVAYLDFFDGLFSSLRAGENVTEVCRREAKLLIKLALDGHADALKILDSSGKPSSGVMEGDVYYLGSYHECLDTVVDVNINLRGQYCMVEFIPTGKREKVLPELFREAVKYGLKPPTAALCLPRSCSKEDVQYAVRSSSDANLDEVHNKVLYCDANQSDFFTDIGALITLSCLLVLFSLAAVATVLDYRLAHKKVETDDESTCSENVSLRESSRCVRCLLAFSFYSNGLSILSVKKVGLSSMHGLKVIGMAQIVFAHVVIFSEYFVFYSNPKHYDSEPRRFATQILYSFIYVVDTFFCLSGILVMYLGMKALQKSEGRLNILQYYFHRYIRLTPVMMSLVAFGMFIYPYIAEGPTWEIVKKYFVYNCRSNWWTNALHVENFVGDTHPCHKVAWYVAVDMQIFLITPFILIPFYKNFKYGVASLVFFMVFATVSPSVVAYIYHVHPYPIFTHDTSDYKLALKALNLQNPLNETVAVLDETSQMPDYVNHYYKKPYCRMSPYIVGMAFGYFLLRTKELVLKKRTVVGLWGAYIVVTLFLLYVPWPARTGHKVTVVESIACMGMARTLWAVCIGWIVVACTYGYGGIINTILSCSIMEVLSKLTFCAYLIHPMVLSVIFGSKTSVVEFGTEHLVLTTIGVFIITFLLSVPASMMFELPVLMLEKELMTKKK